MQPHLSAETITRLLSETLTPEEWTASDVHLRGCPECRDKLDEATATVPAVAVALAPVVPVPSLMTAAPPAIELIRLIGVGKTASVYEARQLRLGRVVALKLLSGGWPSAEEARRRFQAEIEAAASQNHPHIVQVFEVGTHQGHPFLVMEYCGGGSLADKLREGPLPPRRAASLIETLARTLHAIHAKGFIHRDLKPGNILFDGAGCAKVADFGVVKRLDAADMPTPVGSVLGTPPYLAPEQIDGSSQVGPGCDVYALGAILYECLVGRPPYPADSPFDALYRQPLPPCRCDPRIPRDLDTICLKCLEKEPKRRYAGALELADDLHRFLDGRPIRARRAGPLGHAWRWGQRNPLAALLSTALALTLLIGLALCGQLWYEAVASRQGAETAQQEAENAHREAEENFLRTRRLLPDLVTASSVPAQQPAERSRIRREALERASSLYRELCRDRPDDRELRGELAHVLMALTDTAIYEGRYRSALPAAEEALALWRQLREEQPREPRWQRGAANNLLRLAMIRRFLGRSREMADANREAIPLFQALADEQPREVGPLLELTTARIELKHSLLLEAKVDEAQSLLEENRRQLEAYRAVMPDSVELRQALVSTLYQLGDVHRTRGEAAAAIRCWREGCKQGIGLDAARPDDAGAGNDAMLCALELPRFDPAALTPDQAIPRLERAVQLLENRYALDPEHTWTGLAEISRRLSACYAEASRPADAMRMERRAAEALPPRPDGIPYLELVRADGKARLASRAEQAGQLEAAREYAQEAADGFEAYCRNHAADAPLLDAAVDFCRWLAPPLRHCGSVDQSRRIVECCLQIVRRRTGANADAVQLRRLAELWTQVAKCRVRDDRDNAEAALREAVDAARRLFALRPEHRYLLDDRLARLARWRAERGQYRQAAACLRERESLWAGDADGLRGVARGYRALAEEMKSRQKILSHNEEVERAEYLAEAGRVEKVADALRH